MDIAVRLLLRPAHGLSRSGMWMRSFQRLSECKRGDGRRAEPNRGFWLADMSDTNILKTHVLAWKDFIVRTKPHIRICSGKNELT